MVVLAEGADVDDVLAEGALEDPQLYGGLSRNRENRFGLGHLLRLQSTAGTAEWRMGNQFTEGSADYRRRRGIVNLAAGPAL